MPTELEIEAACRGMYGKNWDGPPEKMPGPQMKEVWRSLARKALEGAETVRADEIKKACTHPNRVGTGMVGSDGSASWDWFCPTCGASDSGECGPSGERTVHS